MIETHFKAMGSEILALLETEDLRGRQALARLPQWFERWESQLSRFRPESDLSALNRSAGAYRPVSPLLFGVVQSALRGARMTGGRVSPALLAPLEAAGYDRTFERIPTSPEAPTAAAIVRTDDWRAIRCDSRSRSLHLPVGVRLDLGGFAKGWAAARAVHKLRRYGPCLVDAGGDIAVSGRRTDGCAWPIAIASPWEPKLDLAVIHLSKGGVATSGRDRRRWRGADGALQHHLIDPQTMKPAQTDILTATVAGPSLEIAEVAAKAVLLMGSRRGTAWLERLGKFGALLTLEDGRIQMNPSMRPLIRNMEPAHAELRH